MFFISIISIGTYGQDSCGTGHAMELMIEEDPNYQSLLDSFDQDYISALPTQNIGHGPNGTYEIPVVFHVYHNNDIENISNAQIHQAMQQLNQQFAGTEGGYDTKISFYLATIDPFGQCTSGINRVQTTNPGVTSFNYYEDIYIKDLSRWDPEKYLNVWILKFLPTGHPGYAFLPPVTNLKDGVVIEHNALGTTETAQGNVINTLTHEIGHYLGLYHVWGPDEESLCGNCHATTDCLNQGDRVCDTNPCRNSVSNSICSDPYFSCTSCPNQNLDKPYPKDNYMSYEHTCQNKFTAGQAERMWHALNAYRSDLWSDENQLCTGITAHYGHNITITDEKIWTVNNLPNSGDVIITGTLTIESGAKLTIEKGVKLHFCENGRVVIKQGGNLYNSGILTNACEAPWQGIEVWGTTNQVQGNIGVHPYHGFYLGQSESIIENANIGIKLFGPDYLSDAGGMVTCVGANFHNCTTSIKFAPYDKGNNYSATISKCKFSNDGSFLPFESFIDMNDVKGVSISGSKFIYSGPHNGDEDIEGYGYGIWAKNSGFKLNAINSNDKFGNPNPSIKCEFNGLGYGIWIANLLGNKYYEIEQAIFANNYVGVYNSGMSLGKILFNDFNFGSVPDATLISSDTKSQIGVMLNGPISGITFQQNDFNGSVGTMFKETGTYINNIGTYNNIINKNNFNQLTYANIASGDNSSPVNNKDYSTGLLYLCNMHEENLFDIALVEAEQGVSLINRRQRRIVGINNNIINAEATGNSFSNSTSETENLFNFHSLDHQYYYNPINPEEIPVNFDPSWTLINSNPNSACSECLCEPPCNIIVIDPDFPGGTGGNSASLSVLDNFNDLKNLWNQIANNNIPYPNNLYDIESSFSNSDIEKFSAIQQLMHPLITIGLQENFSDEAVFNHNNFYWWLSQINTYEGDIMLALEYASDKNFNQCEILLNTIVDKWDLDYSDTQDFLSIVDIYNIIKYDGWSNLSQNNIDNLMEIYNLNFGYSSEWASMILNANGIKNPISYNLPIRSDRKLTDNLGAENRFDIHPNPATSFFKLSFNDDQLQQITLTISDLKGNTMLTKIIENNVIIGVSELPIGVYIYTIENSLGVILQSERIVITK